MHDARITLLNVPSLFRDAFDCDSRLHMNCPIRQEVKGHQENGILAKRPLRDH